RSWTIEAWMNMLVNTVSQAGTPWRAWLWLSAWGTAPYLASWWSAGPLISDPPWKTASRYTITLTTINATVTSGKPAVGMLSLIGIIGRPPPGREMALAAKSARRGR